MRRKIVEPLWKIEILIEFDNSVLQAPGPTRFGPAHQSNNQSSLGLAASAMG